MTNDYLFDVESCHFDSEHVSILRLPGRGKVTEEGTPVIETEVVGKPCRGSRRDSSGVLLKRLGDDTRSVHE